MNYDTRAADKIIAALADRRVNAVAVGILLQYKLEHADSTAEREIINNLVYGLRYKSYPA